MALKPKSGGTKGASKRSGKPSSTSGSSSKSGPASRSKKPGTSKPTTKTTQQKTKSVTSSTKKKPPHMRYSEKELNVPQLNGIRPTGVQKAPHAKKGKNFVDDKDSMNTILAMVMAEKEGNIESKMMRARHLEALREARRIEAEKRVTSKKEGLEDRKQDIKDKKKRSRQAEGEGNAVEEPAQEKTVSKKPRKRVSFG